MDKVEIITDQYDIEHVIIDRGNGEFTSMPKSVYEEQQNKSAIPTATENSVAYAQLAAQAQTGGNL